MREKNLGKFDTKDIEGQKKVTYLINLCKWWVGIEQVMGEIIKQSMERKL